MPWGRRRRDWFAQSMVLANKDPTMPRDLPDLIPGSGTGAGYSPPREEDGDDIASAYSLASTAHDLVVEHGRRYPNYRYGQNPFPQGDDLSQQHETALHNLTLYLLQDKLFNAPVDNPRNALDVKCGQLGLWSVGMADAYPNAQITGMDVSPPVRAVSENLEFHQQSYNDMWILNEVLQTHGKFDLIYARGLFAGSTDYSEIYRQCFENLEPGGYLEQNEFDVIARCDDDCYRPDSVIPKLTSLVPRLSEAVGADFSLASSMRRFVEAAGFTDIYEKKIKVPLTPWATPGTDHHDVGRLMQKFYETGLQGWLMQPLVRYLNYKPEQVNAWCDQAFEELKANDQHWYFVMVTITARKPSGAPT